MSRSYLDPSDIPGAIAAMQATPKFNTLSNASGQTLTAAQMLQGILARSGAAGVSDTTPTAAALVAAVPGVSVGDVVTLLIRNANSGTLTILAGNGVTLEGTTTIATNFAREYAIRFTAVASGSEAVTLSGLRTAAV